MDKDRKPSADSNDTPDPLADAPFLVRGMDGDRYVFVCKATGAIRRFTAFQLYRRTSILSLASGAWWEVFYAQSIGGDGKSFWRDIGYYLQQVCESRLVGKQVGCMGVWRDKRGIVVHCGNDFQKPDGEWTKPWLWTSANYAQLQESELAIERFGVAATEDETRSLVEEIRTRWNWKAQASGYLVSGWIMLAPVANCLDWRPHILVSGAAKCGKTELLGLVNALCRFVHFGQATSATVASLLRRLGGDHAFSCILDEFDGPPSKRREVFRLARSCTAGPGIKHARGRGTIRYRTRAMFLFASKAGSVPNERRFSLCELNPPATHECDYQLWRENMRASIESGLPNRLLARTVRMLRNGTVERSIEQFRDVIMVTPGLHLHADQLGSLFAGAWLMLNHTPPTESEAREFVKPLLLQGDGSDDSHITARLVTSEAQGRAVLNRILRIPVALGSAEQPAILGQVIADVMINPDFKDALTKLLDEYFIRVRADRVLFGRQSRRIHEELEDSNYADRWWHLLGALPGATTPTARDGGRVSFRRVRTRVVSVPADVVIPR